ncbi:hypothetical protein SSX86_016809 [Deinandra increscens subsp. villosa]|uniref:Gnk2-homologous domain-containing protein n=1 Tax=Deinandra increscens subsp. villosa TaxID=3103831 RepID=A0AAP0CYR2_9ASTR
MSCISFSSSHQNMYHLTRKLFFCLLSSISIYLINTPTTTLAQPPFLHYYCENAANYTQTSTYQRNLNATLTALPTTNNGFGFYNLTTTQGNDTVNSVALCRGDISPDAFRSCVNDSIVNLRQICPNQKEATGYYDNCLLRIYSNKFILGSTRISLYHFRQNRQNSTDVDEFNGYLRPLLTKLRGEAAAGGPLQKFAMANTTGPGFSTIYGLVQCSPDLSDIQCSDCLENIINRIVLYFNGKVGGRILVPMCNFRYENYRFFNQSARVIRPPPPSPPSTPPPTPSIPRATTPPVMSSSKFSEQLLDLENKILDSFLKEN